MVKSINFSIVFFAIGSIFNGCFTPDKVNLWRNYNYLYYKWEDQKCDSVLNRQTIGIFPPAIPDHNIEGVTIVEPIEEWRMYPIYSHSEKKDVVIRKKEILRNILDSCFLCKSAEDKRYYSRRPKKELAIRDEDLYYLKKALNNYWEGSVIPLHTDTMIYVARILDSISEVTRKFQIKDISVSDHFFDYFPNQKGTHLVFIKNLYYRDSRYGGDFRSDCSYRSELFVFDKIKKNIFFYYNYVAHGTWQDTWDDVYNLSISKLDMNYILLKKYAQYLKLYGAKEYKRKPPRKPRERDYYRLHPNNNADD